VLEEEVQVAQTHVVDAERRERRVDGRLDRLVARARLLEAVLAALADRGVRERLQVLGPVQEELLGGLLHRGGADAQRLLPLVRALERLEHDGERDLRIPLELRACQRVERGRRVTDALLGELALDLHALDPAQEHVDLVEALLAVLDVGAREPAACEAREGGDPQARGQDGPERALALQRHWKFLSFARGYGGARIGKARCALLSDRRTLCLKSVWLARGEAETSSSMPRRRGPEAAVGALPSAAGPVASGGTIPGSPRFRRKP
jgi:hypothetical protein